MLEDAGSQELDPATATPIISLASCPVDNAPKGAPRLAGNLQIRIKPDSLAFAAYRSHKVEEKFSCNYELNPDFQPLLERSGLQVSGVSQGGAARIIELPHWFFLATGFLPQYSSEIGKPHPLIVAFLKAALRLKSLKNKGSNRPVTLDNRWDILYRYYPEVYDEFAKVPKKGKTWMDAAKKIVDFKNKVVADIGSGSGTSTFDLARFAKLIIGIEPEDAMADLARKNASMYGFRNIEFKKGSAVSIPLEDGSVDAMVSVYGAFYYDTGSIRRFVQEAERITKPGGYIVLVATAPGWHGGELAPVILGKTRKTDSDDMIEGTLVRLGFDHKDYYYTSDFGTVNKAVRTYGFIFGHRAQQYLRDHQQTTIKWKGRTYYKVV